MNLRPYQSDAANAVNRHLQTRTDNPLVSIPTAGGKTIVFASLIQQWLQAWSATRVIILAHVHELLSQAEAKLKTVWPAAPVGVWSAGLKRRQGNMPVTIAGVQSIYKRAFDFDPYDIIIVDEAHLIPVSGEGMYRQFVRDCLKMNQNCRVLGFTATPYRLDGGHIARKDYVLNHVCYEANIRELIEAGFICQLRSKATDTNIDVSGVKISKGDYVASDLQRKANTDDAVGAAVDELVRLGANRKTWLIFCCGKEHAGHVSDELARRGIVCPCVTDDTATDERRRIIADLDGGKLRGVCNVNCLTTGLDVTRIDMIALLRPTQSTSLYVQMVGRGFRLHPGKTDCLVLDFGGNVRRHGPVDAVNISFTGGKGKGDGEPPSKTCPECREIVAAQSRECPCCGFEFPKSEVQHATTADNAPILSSADPWEEEVVSVEVAEHSKDGKPSSLRVTYHTAADHHRQWICLEHGGLAQAKAEQWWRRRFGDPVPKTIAEAMTRSLFIVDELSRLTKSISIQWAGKYREIVGVTLRGPHCDLWTRV